MTENINEGASIWESRAEKLIIVAVIFPVLVTTFHLLVVYPTGLLIGLLLLHFTGHPFTLGKILSIIALVPACWASFAVCKMIWPSSK